jgi:hypothetical protein
VPTITGKTPTPTAEPITTNKTPAPTAGQTTAGRTTRWWHAEEPFALKTTTAGLKQIKLKSI